MKRVLISVSDKRGLVPFAKGLVRLGFEIIATEGTARILKKKGIPVKTISEITGFKEILEGRVKTLHPAIFGGVLALREKKHLKELAREDIKPIDLVVVNLYPFHNLESIDIGGTALIRSAVKNFKNVGVVIESGDYKKTLNELRKRRGNLPLKTKENLARKALVYILHYDRMVYGCLTGYKLQATGYRLPEELFLEYKKVKDLRYGENPHQKAAFYRSPITDYRLPKQLGGKELSFNNILDLDAAWSIIREFKEPTAVIIKHTNPCGVARDKNLVSAYQKARDCDPLSAFGGVIGLNRKADISTAKEITSTFIEAVIAPGFTPQAIKVLKKKKNLRVVQCPMSPSGISSPLGTRGNVQCQKKDLRTVDWGLLVQDKDIKDIKTKNFKTVTKRKPTKEELAALFFAWKVAKYVKSNAIVISSENQTLVIGAGQTSRIDAVKIAISKMQSHIPHPTSHTPIVLASDGFFPFRDSIDESAKAKISAIIQPGGSIRDREIIKACNEYNMAM
ncbi:bifunctional phosphoribosylaminoimidazolecarboxamide formyltransferase/IMP cyclohydrolase, partial [bacterium]|nr:bifunctional phosphoribosylaminoimidazolecarboxamide formyltransferase/IMP cyclohydrolase [bacterium]